MCGEITLQNKASFSLPNSMISLFLWDTKYFNYGTYAMLVFNSPTI